MLIKLSDGLNR